MTIPFGRRQLTISLIAAQPPARPRALDALAAQAGTDLELAHLRLRNAQDVLADRARWDAMALLYGAPNPH